jgi:hypothetical protein
VTLIRQDLTFDVTAALPAGQCERAVLSATVVAAPAALPERPVVILAVPGLVIPEMAHMHNFAGTRTRLWDRFSAWLAVLTCLPVAAGYPG